jgi:outer membrane usher protein
MARLFIYCFSLILVTRAVLVHADDRRALLELRVNEVKKGAVNVVLRDDDILARVADIEAAGLVSIGGRLITIRESRYISLKSLAPAVRFHLDGSNLVLRLTVNPSSLGSDTSDPHRNELKSINESKETVGFVEGATLFGGSTGPGASPEAPAKGGNGLEQPALLDLHVNGLKKVEALVLLRADDVLSRRADLEVAGLVSIHGRTEEIRGETHVSLKSLAPTVTFEVDEKELALRLTVKPAALGSNIIDLHRFRPAKIEYREDTSGFVNYAFNLRNFSRFYGFSEAGVSFTNNLLYSGLSRNADGAIVRGLSNLTINYRESLNRAMLGDRLVASDVLGGNLVMGGISFFREFGLDPYFTRNPGLHYSGAAATPSTIDVYVNGVFLRRVQLPPGQFELKDLPVPTGSADTRFVLRDAFGREQEIFSPFYFTAGLLKKGLHEFSYNFGVRREDLATDSWNYGQLVFLGRQRIGVTDSLTAGLRFEATSKIASGGPSVSFLLPLGEMELSAAASQDQGSVGGGAFIGYSYGGRLFNFGTSVRFLSPHYATTSLKSSDARSWLQLNTVLGFSVAERTGVSLQYTLENSQKSGAIHRYALSTTTRLLSRLNLFVRGGYSRGPEKDSTEITTGLSFLFGEINGALSYRHDSGVATGTASVQQSLPTGSGFGYLVQANTSQGRYAADSLLQYQGPYGRYEAYYGRLDDQNSTLLSASGGFVYLGGSLLATRPVQESFALIRVPGLAGIRGYTNNLEVGSSDSKGNLLVPNLLPYYGNKLSISDKDIPLNYNIPTIDKIVAPPYRGGAVVTFPVQRIQRLAGTITLDKSGQIILPSYGELLLTANGSQLESPIGRDGEFYLENVPAGHHRAIVNHGDQSCEFEIDVPSSQEAEIQVGDLRCVVH